MCASGDRGEAGDGRSAAQQQEDTVQPVAGPRRHALPRQPVPQQHGESPNTVPQYTYKHILSRIYDVQKL